MSSAEKRKIPEPSYILRGHASQIHAISFARSNSRIVTGDADGWIVLWGTSSRRPVSVWKAHEGAILGLKEWGETKIISHGRDNKLFVWKVDKDDEAQLDKTLPAEVVEYKLPQLRKPWLLNSLTMNSLNFCAFALCPKDSELEVPSSDDPVLIAIPGLTDSDKIDVWTLPDGERRHDKIGTSKAKTGMAMSIALFHGSKDALSVAAGYESGHVCLYSHEPNRNVWVTLFCIQLHSQPVLSIDISPSRDFLVSSSADVLVCKYSLPKTYHKPFEPTVKQENTGHSGQQSIQIRNDGKIFATAGWDSKIRVYSCKTLKSVAVLKWHVVGCYAVAFSRVTGSVSTRTAGNPDVEVDKTDIIDHLNNNGGSEYVSLMDRREQKECSKHWVAGGAKDGKISLWEIF